jgi:hypothetical protein
MIAAKQASCRTSRVVAQRTIWMALLWSVWLVAAAAGCAQKKAEPPPAAESSAVRVTDVVLGRAVGADKTISEKTERFSPSDDIYASVVTDGAAPSATIEAKWTYQDGQTVTRATEAIAPTGRTVTEFHISKPDGWPVGKYKVEISLNGALAQTKEFEVVM